MSKLSKVALILGLAGGLASLPSVSAQQRDDRNEGRDEGGVAGAIRYERAKEAAAERQARMEEGRDRGGRDRDSADRMMPRKAKDVRGTTATARRVPPPERKPE